MEGGGRGREGGREGGRGRKGEGRRKGGREIRAPVPIATEMDVH